MRFFEPSFFSGVCENGGQLEKYRDVGSFSWGSECCTHKTRIIDVVYNASNSELGRSKTLVKNCIVLVDSNPYRQWYESHYALPLGRKKGAKLTPEEKFEHKKQDQFSVGGAVPAGEASCVAGLLAASTRGKNWSSS